MKNTIRATIVATAAAAVALTSAPMASAQEVNPLALSIELLPYVSIYQPSYYGWYVPDVFNLGAFALGGAFDLGGQLINGITGIGTGFLNLF